MDAVRLASLTCSNTEILVALGLADRIVAVDDHSDAPEIQHVPRVGPDLGIDVHRLVGQAPDLVLASLSVPGMERVVDAVRETGLPVLVLDPTSWHDVHANIRNVAEATGVTERAEPLIQGMQAEVHALRASFPVPPRVAVEWWPRPVIVAARHSWVTDMLRDLGAVNAFEHLDARSQPISVDDLRAARPDLLVISWCGVRKLRPEVAEARGLGIPVVCIPESGLGRPGPRLIEGYRALAAALARLRIDAHPDGTTHEIPGSGSGP